MREIFSLIFIRESTYYCDDFVDMNKVCDGFLSRKDQIYFLKFPHIEMLKGRFAVNLAESTAISTPDTKGEVRTFKLANYGDCFGKW